MKDKLSNNIKYFSINIVFYQRNCKIHPPTFNAYHIFAISKNWNNYLNIFGEQVVDVKVRCWEIPNFVKLEQQLQGMTGPTWRVVPPPDPLVTSKNKSPNWIKYITCLELSHTCQFFKSENFSLEGRVLTALSKNIINMIKGLWISSRCFLQNKNFKI